MGGEILENVRHQCAPVGVAQYHVGILQCSGGFREGLGHTAGEYQYRVGVVFAGTVQGLANLVIAGGGNGAGVNEHHIRRFSGGTNAKSGGRHLGQHGLGFILIDLAAKGDGGDFHHHWETSFHTKSTAEKGLQTAFF